MMGRPKKYTGDLVRKTVDIPSDVLSNIRQRVAEENVSFNEFIVNSLAAQLNLNVESYTNLKTSIKTRDEEIEDLRQENIKLKKQLKSYGFIKLQEHDKKIIEIQVQEAISRFKNTLSTISSLPSVLLNYDMLKAFLKYDINDDLKYELNLCLDVLINQKIPEVRKQKEKESKVIEKYEDPIYKKGPTQKSAMVVYDFTSSSEPIQTLVETPEVLSNYSSEVNPNPISTPPKKPPSPYDELDENSEDNFLNNILAASSESTNQTEYAIEQPNLDSSSCQICSCGCSFSQDIPICPSCNKVLKRRDDENEA